MTAEELNIALDKQEMKRTILKRCSLCGRDKEYLFAQVLKVNQKTFDKLNEVSNEFSQLTILNQTNHIPEIDGVIDDFTLKVIKGMGYQVSFRMCQECIHKIGWRHKYKKKPLYATR